MFNRTQTLNTRPPLGKNPHSGKNSGPAKIHPQSRKGSKMVPSVSKELFGSLLDRSGLTLTDDQKSVLFEVYPMLQAMIARATAPMPREAEPALIFVPEVK